MASTRARPSPRRPARLLLLSSLAAAGTAGALGAGALWAGARMRPPCPHTAPPEPPPGLPPGRIVHVPGRGEFFVREAGAPDAPTVLLLHGWMFPSDLNWWASYGALAKTAHVIAADHRGHGRGPRPSQPFRLVDVADDAAALLRHLGCAPAVAVGYSMGGTIAQLLLRRHPDVVRGLVLCATAATFSETARDRVLWRAMGLLQVLLRLAPRDWCERALLAQANGQLRMQLTRLITDDTPDELVGLLPWITGELDRGSAEDVAEAGRELGRYDARDWIGSVDVPTAVLVTLRDRLVPPHRQRDLAERIAGSERYELPVDHDGVVTRPDVFVPALLKGIEYVLGAHRG